MSAPLVYRKRLFTASVDDNESGKAAVVCMDAQNGTVCWRYSLRGSVRSSIAIADGLVFAQDVHGYLYAIQAETGTLVWEKDLNIGVLPPLNDGLVSIIGEPLADGNKDVLIFNLPSYESCCKSVKRWVKRAGIDKHIS